MYVATDYTMSLETLWHIMLDGTPVLSGMIALLLILQNLRLVSCVCMPADYPCAQSYSCTYVHVHCVQFITIVATCC